MKNLFLKHRIKKELKEFRKFKKNYTFEMKKIEEKKNGSLFVDGVCLKDENNEWIGESETFINVGYKIHGALPKVLSNLFHYEFVFRGKKVSSVEGVLQGLKFKDKNIQRKVFNYFGLDANNIKIATDYDWTKTGILYFAGKPIVRNSEEYYDFIDELYISLLQNPLFRDALNKAGNKYILHSIGESDTSKTVFARCEFEFELNCIKEFILTK